MNDVFTYGNELPLHLNPLHEGVEVTLPFNSRGGTGWGWGGFSGEGFKGLRRIRIMYRWSVIKILAPWFVLLAFTSCGPVSLTDGNNNLAGGGIGGTGISVGKITAAGGTSVDVNGVAFDVTNAAVTVDGKAGNKNNLKVGMIVKVEGTFNTDGISGLATNVDFKDILEGPVDYVDAVSNTIAVLGQTIAVDSATNFDDFTDIDNNGIVDLSDIVAGNVVEISGYVDSKGVIHASYISLQYETFEGSGSEIELKGIVTDLNAIPGTFKIRGLTIEFTMGTEFKQLSINDLKDGLYVEVKSTVGLSGGVLIAGEIELEDHGYNFKDNDEFEIEGYVTALSLNEGKFEMSGLTVLVISTTRYKDGKLVNIADIKVDMKLEVEGVAGANGIIIAEEIEVESGDDDSDNDSHDEEGDH